MDNGGEDRASYVALLEKMVLESGKELPDVYAGLRGKELNEHERRVGLLRQEAWQRERAKKST